MQSVCLFNISIKNQCFSGRQQFAKSAYIIRALRRSRAHQHGCKTFYSNPTGFNTVPSIIQPYKVRPFTFVSVLLLHQYLESLKTSMCRRTGEDRNALLIPNVSDGKLTVTNRREDVLGVILRRVCLSNALNDRSFCPHVWILGSCEGLRVWLWRSLMTTDHQHSDRQRETERECLSYKLQLPRGHWKYISAAIQTLRCVREGHINKPSLSVGAIKLTSFPIYHSIS